MKPHLSLDDGRTLHLPHRPPPERGCSSGAGGFFPPSLPVNSPPPEGDLPAGHKSSRIPDSRRRLDQDGQDSTGPPAKKGRGRKPEEKQRDSSRNSTSFSGGERKLFSPNGHRINLGGPVVLGFIHGFTSCQRDLRLPGGP